MTQTSLPTARITHCRSCNAPIIWLRTDSGKSIPVEPGNVAPEDELFKWGHHVSHFAKCPYANQHRRS